MLGNRRETPTLAKSTAVEDKPPENDRNDADVVIVEDVNSSLDSEIALIRRRWELASVLNFLTTFEPIIGSDLKLTAEEIENGLVKPDSSLARLHIKLLKGIPPVSKTLNETDAWVTSLCKKIAIWWPWVAEGELPLTAAKGEEIPRYRELEPTTRLRILKALCEIRADQHDAVKYINDALKSGSQISCFRKIKIGGDGNATSYWYDGGTVIGHRLYKEVTKAEPKSKMKGKASNWPSTISLQWETLATNFNEFQKIVDELSSSKVVGETDVGKIIKTDFVPAVEKFQKKKERELKQKQRQERLLNDFRSYGTGATRSCRNHEYDRAIDEAIEISKKRKITKETGNNKLSKQGKLASDGGSNAGMGSKESHSEDSDSDTAGSKDETIRKSDPVDGESENYSIEQDSKGDDKSRSDEDASKSDNYESSCESESSGDMDNDRDMNCCDKLGRTRAGKCLVGGMNHPDMDVRNLTSKTRLRQRPTRNSALDTVVPDSEDGSLSDNTNGDKSGCDDFSPVADSEEVSDS